MDQLATFAENPLRPAVWDPVPAAPTPVPPPPHWLEGAAGIVEIGHDGAGFAFDCEAPRHPVLLPPHALADRLVTNGEWLSFIESGGYADPLLWLSDGWAWAKEQAIEAPLYWRRDGDGGWQVFGLDGERRRAFEGAERRSAGCWRFPSSSLPGAPTGMPPSTP